MFQNPTLQNFLEGFLPGVPLRLTILLPMLALALLLKLIPSKKKRKNKKYSNQDDWFDDDSYSDDKTYNYTKTKLLTPPEFAFFKALEPHAKEKSLLIFPKVRIADIINVAEKPYTTEWHTARNKIERKHVDFVLCDKNTLQIQYIIELDDPSHERPDRKKRDIFVDQTMEKCGYKILHFKTGQNWDFSMIQTMPQKETSNT